MGRHVAVVGRWESLRLSFSGLVRAGVAGFAFVAACAVVFWAWDERHVLGQPDEQSVVQDVVEIGDIGQGRGRCPGVDVRLVIATPRPDLPDRTGHFRACAGEYRPGDEVLVRRVPGHPDRTYDDPLDLPGILLLGLVAGAAVGVLAAVGAVIQALWEERTRPRRRARGVSGDARGRTGRRWGGSRGPGPGRRPR
ncbi:MAG TPA: hypothetical protein VI357_03995 [Mycobacteriales bacterium]